MKIVNEIKQNAVLVGYVTTILPVILQLDKENIEKEYHFTEKDLLNVIFDSVFEQNHGKFKNLDLTPTQTNRAVYICQQLVNDVDYANNLFALSQKYRNLV